MQVLGKDEVIIKEFQGKIHWGLFITGILLSVIIIGIPIAIIAFCEKYRKYTITNKRFIVNNIFSTTDYPISKIESVEVNFSKELKITLSGGKKEKFQFLRNPKEIAETINTQL